MDSQLSLTVSDTELFPDEQRTPVVPETPPSPAIRRRQRTRETASVTHGSGHRSPGSPDAISPSQSNSPGRRSRLRRPRDIAPPRRRSPRRRSPRRRSPRRLSPSRSNASRDRSPCRRPAERRTPPNPGWTVRRLKDALNESNIPFCQSDRKARLYQRLTEHQRNTTALPGSERSVGSNAHDVTVRTTAVAALPHTGDQAASHPPQHALNPEAHLAGSFVQPSTSSNANAAFHPSNLSQPSFAPAPPPYPYPYPSHYPSLPHPQYMCNSNQPFHPIDLQMTKWPSEREKQLNMPSASLHMFGVLLLRTMKREA
ncbi:hypothetical protein EYF80_006620 [Liparis tanakae]|uniref:Uncharacterized protein n=1 Tax=Liparis tanakae TaxID=230148 RepID=A0A4Z2J0N0_9TELE|nr:hypothetical protein EYF80_006620 [Liparis tanakae]